MEPNLLQSSVSSEAWFKVRQSLCCRTSFPVRGLQSEVKLDLKLDRGLPAKV